VRSRGSSNGPTTTTPELEVLGMPLDELAVLLRRRRDNGA
jgi:hypothetical protein